MSASLSIFDYRDEDLYFAHWLSRKGELLSTSEPRGTWGNSPIHVFIDARLNALRKVRNPNCSIYIMEKLIAKGS